MNTTSAMNALYQICVGLSLGIFLGVLLNRMKVLFGRKAYSDHRVQAARKFVGVAVAVLKYVTFLLLGLGLIWCVYFLALGVFMPQQAEYASNMAQLVVSLLTVISILFAVVEFLRRKDGA